MKLELFTIINCSKPKGFVYKHSGISKTTHLQYHQTKFIHKPKPLFTIMEENAIQQWKPVPHNIKSKKENYTGA